MKILAICFVVLQICFIAHTWANIKLQENINNRLNCLEQGMMYIGNNFCAPLATPHK